MKRAIGFAQGQFGDLVIGTVPARALKQIAPDVRLTLGLNKRYAEIAPLFANHPYYADIHFYDAYDNWPSEIDRRYLETSGYDIVFDPMPKRGVSEANWWVAEHQAQNSCTVYGLPYPTDGYHCELTQWFDITPTRDTIALAPFAGWYNPNNDKRLSVARAQEVVDLIRGLGYKVLQIGGHDEPALEGAMKPRLSYFESVKAVLGCKMLVHCDSGISWASSAYKFPQLGLYSNRYYGADRVCAIQPCNPNAVYLDAPNVHDISLDLIRQQVEILTK